MSMCTCTCVYWNTILYYYIVTYIRYRTELGLFTVTLVNSFKKTDYFHVFAFLEKKDNILYMYNFVVTY